MKKMLLLLLLPVIGFIAIACSDSSDDTVNITNLVLSSDRTYILADGKEMINLTVKDNEGNDLTSQCVLKANDEELPDNTFKTQKAGPYKIVAIFKGIRSNTLDVIAMSENVKMKIASDKESVFADGGDFVCLYLVDEQGSKYTDVDFFADGKPLNDSYFSTTIVGEHYITAKWNGIDVDGEFLITANPATDAVYEPRMLLESITGTDCPYCAATITMLTDNKDGLVHNYSQLVLIEIHGAGSRMWEKYDERTQSMVNDFISYYEASSTPSVYFDRVKERMSLPKIGKDGVLSAVKSKADVGIAIKNTISKDKKSVNVSAIAATKKAFSGKIIAALVEDGIYMNHVNLGRTEWFHTMRDYQPSFEGGKAVPFTPGKLQQAEFTFNFGNAVREQCSVVVFVVNENGLVENVREIPVNTSIGY